MRYFQTEVSLNVQFSAKTISYVSQLEKLDANGFEYHLYAILLAPRFYYKPESLRASKEGIKFTVFAPNLEGTNEFEIPIQFHKELDHRKINFASTYPYSTLKGTITDADWLVSTGQSPEINESVSEIFDRFAPYFLQEIRYKVLYIGQAYGNRGERDAIQRLSSHKTLQEVLTAAQRDYSAHEIKILLLEIKPFVHFGIVTPDIPTIKSSDEDDAHIRQVTDNLPEERQIVNITEAALIHYFQPKYNKDFVENFPKDTHLSYRQFFDLDYNEIGIELGAEYNSWLTVELYSDSATIKSDWDLIRYQLNNAEDRDSMYAIFQTMDNPENPLS